MERDTLKKKLYGGQICLGTWMFIPSPDLMEIVGLAGFDFAVIDMEHSPITYADSIAMMRAAESRHLTPIVRVSSLDASSILRSLDSGAHGIQLPHIENKQDCLDAVKYIKYFPQGERGLGTTTRGGNYSLKGIQEHIQKMNATNLVIVSLESEGSILGLSEMLDVEGIDVIYIAPYDLSQSLGLPGEVEHPKVLHCLEKTAQKIREAGRIAGSFASTPRRAKIFKEMGIQYLSCQADGSLIRDAYDSVREEIL